MYLLWVVETISGELYETNVATVLKVTTPASSSCSQRKA